MNHTINDMVVVRKLISEFIEDTDYKLKPVNRDVEPGDVFGVDGETGNIINYGTIDDILHTNEFLKWTNKYLGEE